MHQSCKLHRAVLSAQSDRKLVQSLGGGPLALGAVLNFERAVVFGVPGAILLSDLKALGVLETKDHAYDL